MRINSINCPMNPKLTRARSDVQSMPTSCGPLARATSDPSLRNYPTSVDQASVSSYELSDYDDVLSVGSETDRGFLDSMQATDGASGCFVC